MALTSLGLLSAFGAGVLSFLSPCVFPLVPGYLSYLAGTSLEVAQNQPSARWRVSLHALCFVLGFALLFTLLGAAAGLAAGLLLAPKTGRQTRSWIGAQARHGGKLIGRSGEFLKKRAEYEGNRLRNLFHDTKRRLISSQEFYASDDLVTQRVKTELAHNPKSREIAGLNVDTSAMK